MYNMRLKEYNNGTLQLTFYSNPIRSKKDKYTTNGDYSGDTFWDEPTRQFDDCDNDPYRSLDLLSWKSTNHGISSTEPNTHS